MTEEFHKPFIKSLIIVAVVTVLSMVASNKLIKYYSEYNLLSHQTIEYSSLRSYSEPKVPDIK